MNRFILLQVLAQKRQCIKKIDLTKQIRGSSTICLGIVRELFLSVGSFFSDILEGSGLISVCYVSLMMLQVITEGGICY